jgi:pyridoxal phosphate enzyme (YggS family)
MRVHLAQETNRIMMSASTSSPEHPSVQSYKQIVAKMQKTAKKSGRDPSEIKLLAVSKEQDWSVIAPIINLGHWDFAENRVQDAKLRWTEAKTDNPNLKLHLIGPLQSNKALEAVEFFDSIQTLDRPSVIEAVAKAIEKIGRSPELMVQVNIGEEAQKSGVMPNEMDQLMILARQTYGLTITGLMAIPPLEGPRGPYFALLANLAASYETKEQPLKLSMGMSDDFETAIEFGSTHVRIGSALFGARH